MRKFLFLCKIADDPLCSFCSQEIETVEHLFWDCDVTRALGDGLNGQLKDKCRLLNYKTSSLLRNYNTVWYGAGLNNG